jgi:hypothetical protein
MTDYETLSLVIQAAGLFFIGLSIIYAGKSFRLSQIKHERELRQESYNYVKELMTEIREPLVAVRNSDVTSYKMEELLKKEEIVFNISLLLNSYESMALAIRNTIYDEEILKASLQYQLISAFQMLQDYIHYRRAQLSHPNIWEGIEWLYHKWSNDMRKT